MREGRSAAADPAKPLFWLMAVLGLVSLLVVGVSAVVLAATWPSAEVRAAQVPISLYAYDPVTRTLSGTPRTTFEMGEVPVARIDFDKLDDLPTGRVNAAWFDALSYRTNSVERSKLSEMTEPVPLSGTAAVPPGRYQFVLSVVDQGRTTEVLARIHVEIE